MSKGRTFPLEWPVRGVADDQAHVKQRELTTPRAKNVRTLQPITDRAQGGQRPGYTDFASAALVSGSRVQALGSVVTDLSKLRYSGFSTNSIERKWGQVTVGNKTVLALAVDDQDYVYALDMPGSFSRFTREGELEGTYFIALPTSERLVRRIQLDREGNVYVASTDKSGDNHSRVWKYKKVEDGDSHYFSPVWDFGLPSGIRDFKVHGGQLVIAKTNPDLATHASFAAIAVYDQLQLSSPTFVYERGTPWPINGMDVGDEGEIYIACPRNTNRSETPGGGTWTDPEVHWSPHALEDDTGAGASERIHFWTSAWAEAQRLIDGDEMDSWWDRRWLHTSAHDVDVPSYSDDYYPGAGKGNYNPDGSHSFIAPNDNARALYNVTRVVGGSGSSGHPDDVLVPPTLRIAGAGGAPTLRFEPDQDGNPATLAAGKQSTGEKEDLDLDTVPDPDGKHPTLGIVPDNLEACFTTFILLRYEPNEEGQCVWFHVNEKDNNRFALLVNADERTIYPSQTNDGRARSLALFSDNVANSTSGVASEVAAVDLSDAEFANDRNVVLVTLQVAGTVAQNNANAVSNCALRVNGRLVDTFTITTPPDTSSASPYYADMVALALNPALGDLASVNLPGFKGDIMEIITVLGDTSASSVRANAANAWPPVTFPNTAWSQPAPVPYGTPLTYTDMSGQNWNSDSYAYTAAATEVERMEGFLCWAYGCPDILKGGALGTPAGGYQQTHPFQSAHPTWLNLGYPVGPSGTGGITIGGAQQVVRSVDELLCKYSPGGELTWATDGFGHGLGVIAGPDKSVYAVGQVDTEGVAFTGHDDETVAKRVKDLGPSVRESGADTWVIEDIQGNTEWAEQSHGMIVDPAGNLYRLWSHQYARQWLWHANTQPLNNDYIELSKLAGGVVRYTFKTVLTGAAYEVLIGTTPEEAFIHLFAAVNAHPFPGLWFGDGTEPHPDVYCYFKYAWGNFSILEFRSRSAGMTGNEQYILRHPVTGGLGVSPWTHETTMGDPDDPVYFIGGQANAIRCNAAEDGAELWSRNYGADGTDDVWPQALAIPQDLPDYGEDFDEGTADVLYVGVQNRWNHEDTLPSDEPGDTLEKLELIQRRQVIGKDASPREVTHLGIAAGSLYSLAKGAAPVLVTGGAGIVQADSPWVRLLTYRSKVYVFDGTNYHVYDPKTDEVEEWKIKQGGRLPYGARLGCVWNGRIVLARTADDPHNLYMSARGDPDDWDYDPAVISPLSAFEGSASGNLHFKKHDLVNCLIPVRDDLLIVGGDSSIHRLTGDPGGQGQLDLLSDSEGLAFGASWCKDPVGNVYVQGVNGGVYRFGVDGSFASLTEETIERRLQDIDQSVFDIVLQWNIRFDGFHLFVIPKADVGNVLVEHYWYDAKYGGWWPDTFAHVEVQPTCVTTFDGDSPEDRVMVVGSSDGFVRFEDEAATGDGDYPIHSQVFIGPLVPPYAGKAVRFSHLYPVLDSRLGSCQIEVYLDEVADFDGGDRPVRSWEIQPGRNGYLMFRAKGHQCWVALNDASAEQSWALEQLTIEAIPAGRPRGR